jgi:hypothetical protein
LLCGQKAEGVVASENVPAVELLPDLTVDSLLVGHSIRIAATPLGERGVAVDGFGRNCGTQLFDEALPARLHAAFSDETHRDENVLLGSLDER